MLTTFQMEKLKGTDYLEDKDVIVVYLTTHLQRLRRMKGVISG